MLIAINDLLVYGAAISRPTGIQRVATGIAAELIAHHNARAAVISGERIFSAKLPEERRHALARVSEPFLKLLSATPRPVQEFVRRVARSALAVITQRQRGAEVVPTDGEWLIILGAPWIAPGMADAAVRLRREHGVKIALLVHDLLPATDPQWFADAQGVSARRDVESLIMNADKIFSVSQEVSLEIRHRYQRNVTVLRPADPNLNVALDRDLFHEPIGERVILTVGTLHPRKNLVALVNIWDSWAERCEREGGEQREPPLLVIAGRRHPQDGALFAALGQHPRAARRIRLIHDADDAALAQLYRLSRFLVMPSLAEGWGMPVMEAIAAGRPAITTDAVPAATDNPFARVIPAGEEEAFGRAIIEWWEGTAPELLAEEIQAKFTRRGWPAVADELAKALAP